MKKFHMGAAAVLIAAASVLVLGITTDAFATTTAATTTAATTATTTTYNPDMTDWWGDMIEALGDKSSATWTEPGWGSDLWVEIEDIGTDKYRISLYGIASSGEAISYTITKTEDGYYAYGPEKEDGSMASRNYVTSAGSDVLAYEISGPTESVIFTSMNKIKALGTYTFGVTLTDLLKDGNDNEILGELGYGFKPSGADRSETKYFYMNFSVSPDELPRTFYIDVSFTDTGKISVTKHYSFSQITHHAYANVYPKGGSIFSSFYVVGEYGKAADEHGNCKNAERSPVIRPDFSSIACVYDSTRAELAERGWHH